MSDEERHLGNLLARIHRDGGHYLAVHGLDKAVADADEAVAQMLRLVDEAKTIHKHAIPALRDAATKPCHRTNCGSVCLCMRCHARKALEVLDPTWRP